MGKITKQHEDKVRSLIKSIKGGNDSAIEELFDLEKEHILHEVEQYSLYWPDTDEILEMAKSQLSYTAKECDIDNNFYVLSLRWSISDYIRDNQTYFTSSNFTLLSSSVLRRRTEDIPKTYHRHNTAAKCTKYEVDFNIGMP